MASKPTHSAGSYPIIDVPLDDVVKALRGGTGSFAIASPFLSLSVALLLARESMDCSKRRFLTAANAAAVRSGYLDPAGVEELQASGFKVRSLLNLHAKVVLTDTWGLVGSGNLTVAGADGGNAELGVVLTNQQRNDALERFEYWWELARTEIDSAWLRRQVAKAPSEAKALRQRLVGFGEFVPAASGSELACFLENAHRSRCWLHVAGRTPEQSKASYWKGSGWIHDADTLSSDVARRPAYRDGDRVVIWLDKPANECVAIVRVVGKASVAEGGGWKTEVKCVQTKGRSRGPALAKLDVKPSSVRRHGHIRLTTEQYILAVKALRPG